MANLGIVCLQHRPGFHREVLAVEQRQHREVQTGKPGRKPSGLRGEHDIRRQLRCGNPQPGRRVTDAVGGVFQGCVQSRLQGSRRAIPGIQDDRQGDFCRKDDILSADAGATRPWQRHHDLEARSVGFKHNSFFIDAIKTNAAFHHAAPLTQAHHIVAFKDQLTPGVLIIVI